MPLRYRITTSNSNYGIVAFICQSPNTVIIPMKPTLSLLQAAKRLNVRPQTIHDFVAKKRLHLVGVELLDVEEVEKLALLMNKLRTNGIATLVEISGKNNEP